MSVDPSIYFETSAEERAAIAAELARLKVLRDRAAPVREEFEARVAEIRRAPKAWQKPMQRKLEEDFAGLRQILRQGEVPVSLMACAECGHPTTSCTCVDATGQPLRWV